MHHFVTSFMDGVTVTCFADSFRKGEFKGLPVVSPEDLLEDDETDMVVVASLYSEQIVGVLAYFGIKSYVKFDTRRRFSKTFLKRFGKRLDNVRKALEEPSDRELFDHIIAYRDDYTKAIYHFDEFVNLYRSRETKGQYLDFINQEAVKAVLDCGSWIGDSAVEFLRFPNLKRMICVDAFTGPDRVAEHYPEVANDPRVSFVINGLSNKRHTQYGGTNSNYGAGNSLRAAVSGHHGMEIICTTIDQIVEDNEGFLPDLIKMDIENYELKALQGAEKTIAARRMQYALSIYHSERHLFEIFEFLDQHLDDYVYRLGHYNLVHVNEVVLYAIPRELYAN